MESPPINMGNWLTMKTTLEIPDELLRRAKATAALRGESLKDFVNEAVRAHLEDQTVGVPSPRGWRSVFGQAHPEAVREIDDILAQEFERIEPDTWR